MIVAGLTVRAGAVELLPACPDLRILAMSATLDTAAVSRLIGVCRCSREFLAS